LLLRPQNKAAKQKSTPVCRTSDNLDQMQACVAMQADLAGYSPVPHCNKLKKAAD